MRRVLLIVCVGLVSAEAWSLLTAPGEHPAASMPAQHATTAATRQSTTKRMPAPTRVAAQRTTRAFLIAYAREVAGEASQLDRRQLRRLSTPALWRQLTVGNAVDRGRSGTVAIVLTSRTGAWRVAAVER
jgi:hypothetical protein